MIQSLGLLCRRPHRLLPTEAVLLGELEEISEGILPKRTEGGLWSVATC
jgi:hypothetical protein